jgi:hypothetical protein
MRSRSRGKEVKYTLEEATKAQSGSRCIALTSNLSARWGWVVDATPRPFYPRGKSP